MPAAVQAATVALFAGSGFALAYGFQALLGDATWAVSTGKRAAGDAALLRSPPLLLSCCWSFTAWRYRQAEGTGWVHCGH